MIYELWEVGTGNVIGDYESELAALEAVREVCAPMVSRPSRPGC